MKKTVINLGLSVAATGASGGLCADYGAPGAHGSKPGVPS